MALRVDLANALESLPADCLEVVLLRDFEELTIAEIAGRLGENSSAIKSRLHRARELVREYLSSPESDGGETRQLEQDSDGQVGRMEAHVRLPA